jgi:hypothetical protein
MNTPHCQHRKSAKPRVKIRTPGERWSTGWKEECYDPLCPLNLRLALQRKCRERGYPFTDRMMEVANLLAPAFAK